jgi:hypothetical protein
MVRVFGRPARANPYSAGIVGFVGDSHQVSGFGSPADGDFRSRFAVPNPTGERRQERNASSGEAFREMKAFFGRFRALSALQVSICGRLRARFASNATMAEARMTKGE